MTYRIVIQRADHSILVPKVTLLRKWIKKVLSEKMPSAEITLRIVEVEEMSALNFTYRHKNGPTNVLSFPFEMPLGMPTDTIILGDIVICADVVNQEAKAQTKLPEAHWAHMIVHGIFHLLGYDHETEEEAQVMEDLEINMLQSLGFSNPYEIGESIKDHE
jgi:probable rRNA maturation factor